MDMPYACNILVFLGESNFNVLIYILNSMLSNFFLIGLTPT